MNSRRDHFHLHKEKEFRIKKNLFFFFKYYRWFQQLFQPELCRYQDLEDLYACSCPTQDQSTLSQQRRLYQAGPHGESHKLQPISYVSNSPDIRARRRMLLVDQSMLPKTVGKATLTKKPPPAGIHPISKRGLYSHGCISREVLLQPYTKSPPIPPRESLREQLFTSLL